MITFSLCAARVLRPQRPTAGGTLVGMGKPGAGKSLGEVRIDMSNFSDHQDPGYYEPTDEANKFRSDWVVAKKRQDRQLDNIGRGVDELKEVAKAQEDALNRGNPILDALDERVDTATQELKNNNVKLKDLVTSLRSTRNFCIDVILVCVLLGIGAYIYNMAK